MYNAHASVSYGHYVSETNWPQNDHIDGHLHTLHVCWTTKSTIMLLSMGITSYTTATSGDGRYDRVAGNIVQPACLRRRWR